MAENSSSKIIELEGSQNKDISDLLELISLFVHDLEAPLVVMQIVLRLIENGSLDLSKSYHSELVQSSKIAVERSRAIIADLLTISRSGQMGIPVDLQDDDICETVRNSIDLIQPAAQENSVNVSFEGPRMDYAVRADPDLLARVLDNLLFKAIRHSPLDSEISLEVQKLGNRVQISILYEGEGFGDINPEELFDKYKQLKLRLKGKHRGVGLGLYFCRKAIIAMGGKIWAQNGATGGSEFVFTLNLKG